RNIPALRCRYDANLLHCRSPFYLCFEHVDNLGAYRIPPETGLLIPSGFDSYDSGYLVLEHPTAWCLFYASILARLSYAGVSKA
ncbi:MAG TPA: hypothetical protein VNZ03_13075, partial [Terriglobales bacterium]|nr:hypothetical protein [Terriglobales bacterium]